MKNVSLVAWSVGETQGDVDRRCKTKYEGVTSSSMA